LKLPKNFDCKLLGFLGIVGKFKLSFVLSKFSWCWPELETCFQTETGYREAKSLDFDAYGIRTVAYWKEDSKMGKGVFNKWVFEVGKRVCRISEGQCLNAGPVNLDLRDSGDDGGQESDNC
jgi:hypothetical protein